MRNFQMKMNSLLVRGNEERERERKGKKMKEKLYLTEGIREQIHEGLKDSLKKAESYSFKNSAHLQVLLLERVILEMLPYLTASGVLNTVEAIVVEYEKKNKEK